MAQAGLTSYQAATFNFIYTDQTPVMAFACFLVLLDHSVLCHRDHRSLTNLFEDLGWLELTEDPARPGDGYM
jgi:hypothetical protein